MKTEVTVSWKAFSSAERAIENRKVFPVKEATVYAPFFDYLTELEICNKVYQETNLYYGKFWNQLERVLPENRSHTALSIGDEVTITRQNAAITYRCAELGWEEVGVKVGTGI